MSRLEAVYQRLPIWMQHAICSGIGWRVQRTRFGPGFRRHLEQAEERMKWSQDRLLAYRDERLRAFVGHCAKTVPYYGKLFDRLGIKPEQIRTAEDLKQLPVLTKEEVQANHPNLLSKAVPWRRRLIVRTSGTTGSSLNFATTLDAIQQQWAVWWRYRRWHGIEPGTWHGVFGGRSVVPLTQKSPPFWRDNLPGRQIFFSGYHMSPENLPAYVEEIRRRQLPWLHGFPSLLTLLAIHLLETDTELGYPVRLATMGAETLLPQQADLIERAFGVRPRQHYGQIEGVGNISECRQGRLHVDEDFAAVEFLPNPDGPGYRILGTNLSNPATPMLRYDTKDVVMLSDAPCPCGLPGRIVQSIDGRCDDYVVLKNGTQVGRIGRIFMHVKNIREAQVYQKQAGEVFIRVARSDGYTAQDEKDLLREARLRLGEDAEIHVEYHDRLQRSAAGKLRLVVSDIKRGKMEAILARASFAEAKRHEREILKGSQTPVKDVRSET